MKCGITRCSPRTGEDCRTKIAEALFQRALSQQKRKRVEQSFVRRNW
jgi:hypothetical protein